MKIDLKEKVKEFPQSSGVYLMKSKSEKIIYVGKAKSLRTRVRSYFNENADHSPKTRLLVTQISDIEFILTKTEVEAFLLEASLIKKHKPKYNIRLKDDKAYPYIKISWSDRFPRLYLSRSVKKDGSFYFGPYTSGGAVFEAIRFLNRTFKIRDCTDAVFKTRKRPCMTWQIGRCTAPCVDMISEEEYRTDVESVKLFLKGQNKKVLKILTDKMKESASAEKFEMAAKIRDSVEAIKSILQKQSVINASSEKDQDAFGFFGDSRGTLIESVHVRQGRVIGTRSHFFASLNTEDPDEDHREWLVSFLNQYYADNIIPDEVLLPLDIGNDLVKLMQAVLKERSGQSVSVRFATDEKGRDLVGMSNLNAKSHFERFVSKSQEKVKGLEEIKDKLGLLELPNRIECYDISHFQGKETVASQVVFEEGVPSKDNYRRYRLKSVQGVDDYASMKEVLERRFAHSEYEYPQLIVVDGGKGQLGVALKVLSELGISSVPVVGLAKSRALGSFQDSDVKNSEERFFIKDRQNPIVFRANSEAYQILVGIRDEAHRFAINYHRKLRENSSLESELDLVIGLGEQRKKELLKVFPDLDSIKSASAEEISAVKGFSRVLAERILLQLNEDFEDQD